MLARGSGLHTIPIPIQYQADGGLIFGFGKGRRGLSMAAPVDLGLWRTSLCVQRVGPNSALHSNKWYQEPWLDWIWRWYALLQIRFLEVAK